MKAAISSLRRIPDAAWAALAFALLAAFLLRDVVLGHGVLSSANSIYQFTPFRGVAPADWQANSNGLLFDLPSYYVPAAELARSALRAGHLPLWDPYIFSGIPLFASQQAAPFAIVSLPVWVLPFQAGLAVGAAFKVWLAGFGTYLLGRRLGLGLWAALAAGTAYALGSFTIVWLGLSLTNVSGLLPWVLLTTEAVCARPRPLTFIAHAVAVAAFIFGGHPEVAMFTGVATVAYFLARVWVAGHRGPALRRRVLFFGGASLAGLGLAAVAILPFLAELGGSVDRVARSGLSVAPRESLLTMFAPDWWGRPTEGSVLGPGNFNERTFYSGALMVLLAPIALWRPESRRRLAPIVTVGLIGLLASTAATWTSELVGKLPVIGLSALGRLGMLITLALALLGGAALDVVVREGRVGLALRYLAAGLAIGVLALVAVQPVKGGAWWDGLREALGSSPFSPVHALDDPESRRALDALGVFHLGAIFRWLLILGAAGLVLLAARSRRFPALLLGPALAGIVAIDMVSFADGYNPVIPRDQVYRPVPASIQLLREREGRDRSTAILDTLPPNINIHYRLHDIRGTEHPKPKRVLDFWRAMLNPDQQALERFKVQNLTPQGANALSLMAVRFVMNDVRDPRPPRQFKEVYRGPSEVVWRNTRALPRAYVARSAQWARSPAQVLSLLQSPSFDPRRTTVLEGARTGPRPARGRVQIVRDEPESVELAATLDRPGFVVLSDSYAHGWHATVDGRDADPVRANYLYRAVRVPAGRHRIQWRYQPAALTAGVVVSLLSVAILAALALLSLRRRRHARPRSESIAARA